MTAIDATLLSVLEQRLLDFSVALFPAPNTFEHTAVTHGPAAWDCCNQLTVSLNRMFTTSPFTQAQSRPRISSVAVVAEFVVSIVRPITNLDDRGNPPSAAVVTTDAKRLATDAHVLYRSLLRASIDGTLFPTLTAERYTFRECKPVGPQGDAGGYDINFEVTLG